MADLPEGIQLLLTAGSQDEAFRECFLEDPLLAARRAGVPLADAERSILRAVPREQLAAMIEGMAVGDPQRRRFLRSAATAALTIFAGTTLAACQNPSKEIESEGPEPEVPLFGVARVMAEARKALQPLMVVVCPSNWRFSNMAGSLPEAWAKELHADFVCSYLQPSVREAVERAGFETYEHIVAVEWLEVGCRTEDTFANDRALKLLPVVLFFDAEGKEIGRCVQPEADEILIRAIGTAARILYGRIGTAAEILERND